MCSSHTGAGDAGAGGVTQFAAAADREPALFVRLAQSLSPSGVEAMHGAALSCMGPETAQRAFAAADANADGQISLPGAHAVPGALACGATGVLCAEWRAQARCEGRVARQCLADAGAALAPPQSSRAGLPRAGAGFSARLMPVVPVAPPFLAPRIASWPTWLFAAACPSSGLASWTTPSCWWRGTALIARWARRWASPCLPPPASATWSATSRASVSAALSSASPGASVFPIRVCARACRRRRAGVHTRVHPPPSSPLTPRRGHLPRAHRAAVPAERGPPSCVDGIRAGHRCWMHPRPPPPPLPRCDRGRSCPSPPAR